MGTGTVLDIDILLHPMFNWMRVALHKAAVHRTLQVHFKYTSISEILHFTILSAIVQGVLVHGRIEEPYALDDAGGSRHSPSSY